MVGRNAENRIQELSHQNQTLTNSVMAADSSHSSLITDREDLHRSLQNERAIVTTLRTELNVSRSELHASGSQRHDSGSDADRLLKLEMEMANIQAVNAGLGETSTAVQDKLDSAMETMRAAQKETIRLSMINAELHAKLSKAEKEIKSQKSKLNAWRTYIVDEQGIKDQGDDVREYDLEQWAYHNVDSASEYGAQSDWGDWDWNEDDEDEKGEGEEEEEEDDESAASEASSKSRKGPNSTKTSSAPSGVAKEAGKP